VEAATLDQLIEINETIPKFTEVPQACQSGTLTGAPGQGPIATPAPVDLLQEKPDDLTALFRITKDQNEDYFSVVYRSQSEKSILVSAVSEIENGKKNGKNVHLTFGFGVYSGTASYNPGHQFVLRPIGAKNIWMEVCDSYSTPVDEAIKNKDFSGWAATRPEYGALPEWCPWHATIIQVSRRGKVIWSNTK
jgi:hypothetical protein